MTNLSISTVITIGSSWDGSIIVKSSSVKVIDGILDRFLIDTEWTDVIARRCYFQAELEHPPPANPLAIVFTCAGICFRPQPSREGYGVNDLPNVVFCLFMRPLALWPSLSHWTFTSSFVFSRVGVIVKASWALPSTSIILPFSIPW